MFIPDWVRDELIKPCEYCNTVYKFGLSPDGSRVTKHYCPNEFCRGTIAQKIVYLVNVLGVKGIKFATALKYVDQYNLKTHLDILPVLFEDKPRVHLSQYMRICAIPGIDTQWDNICSNKTLQDIIDEGVIPKDYLELVLSHKDLVHIVEDADTKYEPVYLCSVMITGDIIGYEPRESFLNALMKLFEGMLVIKYSKSKRKTGINYLIKEENSDVTGKVAVAKEMNIPIVTSNEFFRIVTKKIYEKVGDKIYELEGLRKRQI